jgi:hypothetical protein
MESILVDVKSPLAQFSSIETNDFQVAVWQERSLAFIQVCKLALWNRTGSKALTWLREDRGLSDATVFSATYLVTTWQTGMNHPISGV